jgi:predicted metalloendopeptidase
MMMSLYLQDLVAVAYVKSEFTGESKAYAKELIHGIEHAFKENLINEVHWMDPATKKAALHKFSAIKNLVGFPPKYRDYTPIAHKMHEKTYVENTLASQVLFHSSFYIPHPLPSSSPHTTLHITSTSLTSSTTHIGLTGARLRHQHWQAHEAR